MNKEKEVIETIQKLNTEIIKREIQKQDIGWIQTHSGLKFYPFAPNIDDINISDIAWSLSHINRFLGHTTSPWSVAQHSILGAWIIYKHLGDKQLAKWFLLHDASEAYLGDLIRPFKVLPQFSFYQKAESRLMAMIIIKFNLLGLSQEQQEKENKEMEWWLNPDNYEPRKEWLLWSEHREDPIIKEMDRLMLYTEISQLRHPIHPDNAYMPGSAEHLELRKKLGWNDNCLDKFNELLNKDTRVIYQIFLADFAKYNKG